ncbi:hypothetical protein ACINNAV72_A0040 [Acinetobacter baumannii Naval-72]|nr:hypothetical protein ACINNAV72_A0040 [Acinetobacter baumannii Naval-72]
MTHNYKNISQFSLISIMGHVINYVAYLPNQVFDEGYLFHIINSLYQYNLFIKILVD